MFLEIIAIFSLLATDGKFWGLFRHDTVRLGNVPSLLPAAKEKAGTGGKRLFEIDAWPVAAAWTLCFQKNLNLSYGYRFICMKKHLHI